MEAEPQVGKMRIRTKLLFGMLAIVILMTVVAWIMREQQTIIENSFALLERMDTVERFLLECRRQEKNFFLRSDQASLDLHAANLDSLLSATAVLEMEVSDPDTRSNLGRLKDRESAYGAVFEDLQASWTGDESEESNRLQDLTVARARECHALVGEIRTYAISRFEDAHATSHNVGILSVVVGLVLSLLIAGLLTRNIVRPLESLRTLAERVSTGDIQDMDVEFSDLDMKRFDSKESFDLARAFRRMVTSLRLMVSTERGLMDDYHMTIVVLTNKAVGPGGRAVIERARTAAGFGSLSDVSPENVDRFAYELGRHLAGIIPNERISLLCEAIQDLKR